MSLPIRNYKIDPLSGIPDEMPCAHCGMKLIMREGLSVNVSPDSPGPKVGDISFCAACFKPMRIGEGWVFEKLAQAEQESLMADPMVMAMVSALQARTKRQREENDLPEGYFEQVQLMCEQLSDWKKANPELSPAIQYNFPMGVAVCGVIPDAIKNHFISVNADATKMLADLGWLTPGEKMPTVIMMSVAMGEAFKDE